MSNGEIFLKNATLATSGHGTRHETRCPQNPIKISLELTIGSYWGSIGIGGRGTDLLKRFTGLYKDNVMVKTLCDVDSKFFEERQLIASKNQNGIKAWHCHGYEESLWR